GLKDVVVVGHSYGGAIALKMATQFNENIKGYLLIAPLAYPDKKYGNQGILKLLTFPYFGEGAAALLGPLIGNRMIEETLTRMIYTNRHKYPENFIPFRQRLWNKTISTTTQARQSENYNRELGEMALHYSTIKHRICLIVGDKDSEDLQRQSQKLSEDIPNIKYLKLSGVNHYVQYDASKELANFLFMLINET
ncbi:MAG TPA: alpha/beta fold hydrolase, partial [Candidatus Wunengus sp. YC65]|uniref:alpha/beta fold hydrolase n=1 Tax=Candidatus Wunengus sp. YC65 TaxID=3367701 RepID=UPI0040291DA7